MNGLSGDRLPERRANGLPRVAFYGGTFDPPHRGHLAVAQAAADRFNLDRVLIAPAGRQPLKSEPPIAPYADRLAMVRLIAATDSRLQGSDVDAPRPGGTPNYTADSLRRLQAGFREETELFIIAGLDAFLTVRRWHDYERLFELAQWIVVNRATSRPASGADGPPASVRSALDRLGLSEKQLERIGILDDFSVPVSATNLRTRLAEGQSCTDELLPAVAAYISAHHLYPAVPRQAEPLP